MHAAEEHSPHGSGRYTIDELAAQTGIASRTIRFYQAKGVLPPPRKHGRIALYDDSHVERLKAVATLQDKGLRLRAIRDIVGRNDLDSDAIQKWLGLGERLGALSQDAPQLLTEDELRQRLGDLQPGTLSQLVRKGAIAIHGEDKNRRYLVHSPALLDVGKRLHDAGIDLDTAVALQAILERRLGRAANELVEFAIKKVGRGFGRSPDPEDILTAVESLFREGVGAQAVWLIFNKEIERALREALRLDGKLLPPTGERRR